MSTKKKVKKDTSGKLSLEEELVLELIKREARRPRFIARHSKILDQNQVVQILNGLEKKDMVVRASQKSWKAKAA